MIADQKEYMIIQYKKAYLRHQIELQCHADNIQAYDPCYGKVKVFTVAHRVNHQSAFGIV